MKRSSSKASLEDILDAFAVEPSHDRQTLERYLRDYPQYAMELADLSRDLSLPVRDNAAPVSAKDKVLIDTAWKRHRATADAAVVDPFAALSVQQLRAIAHQLDIPRQIVTAFREGKVLLSSVPRGFLTRMAEAMNTTVEVLTAALALPQKPRLTGSYKADQKPKATKPVTFEQVLIDAGVPAERRARLLKDNE